MAKSFSVSITGNQNIGGRKTFNETTTFKKGINLQGVLDLGANTTATTQDSSDNSNKLATTAYVKLAVATGGVSLGLDNLSDVVLTGVLSTSHVLKYDGTNWVNTTLTANDLPSNIAYLNTSNKIDDTLLDLSTISIIGGITLSNILIRQNNLSDLTNSVTARTNLGLGTSATLNVGTNPNNIVQLNSSGALPTVSGGNLTNLSTNQIVDINLYALNTDLGTLSNRVSTNEIDISTIETTISNLSSGSLSDGGLLVKTSDLINYALLNNPTFTGIPKVPTQIDNSNPTAIATTQYVENKFNSISLNLDNLSNITLTTPTTNQVLKYNGSIWVNSYLSSTSLIDTTSIMYKSESLLGIDAQQGRTNLGLGTASTYSVGTSSGQIPLAQNVAILTENKISLSVLPTSVLKTTSSISDLSDVGNLSGIANGQILIWQDTEFIKGDLPTSTYTDADAINAISNALINGKITYSYDVNTNKITSTLDISSLDLSDVNSLVKMSDLTSYALSSDLILLSNRVSTTESDISTIETTISNLSSGSLSDGGTLALKSDLTSYALLNNPTFTGIPKAPTQIDNSNPTAIATTQYVENAIALAGGITQLSQLTDVLISNLSPKDTLFYNTNDNKFTNRQITIADISDFGSYALSGDLTTLSNRVSTTELDIIGLDSRVSTIEGNYALNSDLTNLSNRVSTTELDITSLNNRMSTSESDITGLDTRIFTIESNYALGSDLNSLSSNVNTTLTNIKTSLGGFISNTGSWVVGGGITTNFLSTATDFTNALDILDGEIGNINLNSLSDVNIANISENNLLKYNGSFWVNGTISSTSLTDTTNIVRKNENNTYSGSNTYSGDLIVYNGYSLLLKDIGGLNTKFSVDSATGNANISGTLSVTGSTTLTTVTATTPSSNDNSTNIATTEWVVDYVQANGGGGGSSTLSGLSDVSISSPAISQILRYNGSAWANTLMSFTELSDTSNVALLNTSNAFIDSISISGSNKTFTIKDSTDSTKLTITSDTGNISTYGDLALQKTTVVSSLTTVYLYVRYNNFSLGDTESIYIFKTSNSGVTREALQLTLVSDSGTNYLQTDTNFAYYRYKSNNGSAQYLNSSNKPNATIQLNVGDTYYIEGVTTYDDGGTPNDIEVFFSTSGTATPTWTSLFPTSLGNQPTPLIKTYQIVLESSITTATLSSASSITNGTVSGGSSTITSDTFTVDSATGNTVISGTLSVTGSTTLATATATTPDTGDNSTKIATTSYVQTAISSVSSGYTEITTPTASNYFNASSNKKYYISPALSSVLNVYLPQSASVGAYVEIHNFGTANNVTVWVYNTSTERIFSCENTIVTSISANLRSTATTRYHCRKFTYIGAKTISGSSYNYWLEIL